MNSIGAFLERFHGIFVPLITPGKQGSIHLKDIETLVDYVIEGGVNGIFVNGTTGEFYILDQEARSRVLKNVVAQANKRVPILAGVTDDQKNGAYSAILRKTRANIEEAIRAGADAVVICPYYYTEINYDNAAQFIIELSKGLDVPLVLYDNPSIQNKRSLELNLIGYLSKQPNIIAIKYSSNNLLNFSELLKLRSEKFRVFQGCESLSYQSLKAGADGIIPSLANMLPGLFWYIYNNYNKTEQSGRIKAAKLPENIDNIILSIARQVYKPDVAAGLKRALAHSGIITQQESYRALESNITALITIYKEVYKPK